MNDAPIPPSRTLVGATIGNYRVVALLGQGGMGAVYLAEHPLIGKKVALKVLRDDLATNPEAVARFFGEARAVNEIGHPNIVDVLDFGQVVWDGRPFVYLIMEYLDGRSLAQELRRGPLPPERALAIADQVADALSASHERGIIHRDLKPDNVFLIDKGSVTVKVLDFGIAKLSHVRGESARTRVGMVLGTPAYMSPEQCEGKGHIDARSDVYALGVVLFEMLCGRPPFVGDGWGELLVQQFTAEPPPPSCFRPDLAPELDALVLRALEKSPDRRFASMAEMRAALQDPVAWASGRLAPLPSWVERADARASSSPGDSGNGTKRPTTLSAAAGQRASTRRPALARAERQRRAGLAVGIVSGAIAVTLGILVALQASRGTTPAKPPTEPARQPVVDPAPGPIEPLPEPPVPAPSLPEPPPTISLTITSVPPGATIFVDGVERGRSGQAIALPRGDKPLSIVVRAKGYRPYRRTITPDVDLSLDVVLKKKPEETTTHQSVCPVDDLDCLLPPR